MPIKIFRTGVSELMTRQEVAQLLEIKTQTLAKWASTKRYDLPYIKVGKAVRYRRSDVDYYLACNTVKTNNAG